MRLYLPLLLTLAACSSQPTENAAVPANAVACLPETTSRRSPTRPASRAATPAPLNPPAPGEPGGLENDTTPVSEAPFTEDSAQGAANVVQTYYALLGEGKYGQAYRLWEPGAAGMTPGAFAASFARYSEYHANIGAPGRIDAGAGQRYVTVPVQVYGRLKEGARPFNMRGSVTLHRAGDIDGATAEQRRWRIRSADIKPRPGEATPSQPCRPRTIARPRAIAAWTDRASSRASIPTRTASPCRAAARRSRRCTVSASPRASATCQGLRAARQGQRHDLHRAGPAADRLHGSLVEDILDRCEIGGADIRPGRVDQRVFDFLGSPSRRGRWWSPQ
jgi:hypothetical protein